MIDLILWRHAEAEEGVIDLERPLTTKGISQAKKMTKWLKKQQSHPTQVWVSEAKRSQQTASFLNKVQIFPELNPNSSAEKVLQLLYQDHWKNNTIIVGHQPWIGQLSAQLMLQQPSRTSWHIKKNSIWWFEISLIDQTIPYARIKAIIPNQYL